MTPVRPIRPIRLIVLTLAALVLAATPARSGPLTGPAAEPHQAEAAYTDHAPIRIQDDSEFDLEHGVRSGNGTARRPYVISGWHVASMVISDTAKHLVIRDNLVDGQLILDWNGPHVHVHGNTVGDLRVNRNVKRTGRATSGMIAHNTFGVVGQLRHFDGVFQHNVVGSPTRDAMGHYRAHAVQFDGFNGSRFVDNTIYGHVEARLHGHHHGSGFGMPSHAHVERMGHADHSKRYHEVWIAGNTIFSNHAYALRYYDTGHAGEDRTNNSETDRALHRPHVHFTRVHLTGNRLIGSGVAVHVFNAPDDHHTGTTRGLIEVRANHISLQDPPFDTSAARDGIHIRTVTDGDVRVIGNVIEAPPAGRAQPFTLLASLARAAGIRIEGVKEGRMWLYENRVTNRHFGVFATRLEKNVRWWIRGLVTEGVAEDVHYDASVRNDPIRQG